MKHIFKKLHIGSNHDPNRSNEAPAASTSTSCASDHQRASSGQSVAQTLNSHVPASPSSAVVPTITGGTRSGDVIGGSSGTLVPGKPDYFSSEEEFQMQLALAISASSSTAEFRDDPENEQIRAATLMSLGRLQDDSHPCDVGTAEALSRQYWDYNVLDYEEKVVDGFYDVFGLCTNTSSQGKLPSLTDLETSMGNSLFEVIIVNRTMDSVLEELVQIAHCMALDFSAMQVGFLVQRLAELVTENMGGPVKDPNLMLANWLEQSTELKTSLHSNILPIGSIHIGLSRHRALLFKVLADNVRIPCRLVKGSHYTGVEDDGINIIKLDNEREFLVDLMAAPGTLLPADLLGSKDNSLKAVNSMRTKLPFLQTSNDFPVIRSPDSLPEWFDGSSQNSNVGSTLFLTNSPSSDMSEINTSAIVDMNVGCSGIIDKMAPYDSSDEFCKSTTGTSTYRSGNKPGSVNDGYRSNLSLAPYPVNNEAADPQNLFADLNPFQINGQNEISNPNYPVESKVENFPKHRIDIVSSRPPLPLLWKNRYACNEVPKTKEHEDVPKNNRQSNDYNLSSLASTTSPSSEKVHPSVFKLSGNLYSATRHNNDEKNMLPLDEDVRNDYKNATVHNNHVGENYRDVTALDKDVTRMGGVPDRKLAAIYDHRKYNRDKFMERTLNLKETANPISSVESSTSRVNQMLDDVGDCEIPWEDLVIGERIGLGSYGEVYRADWNGTEVAVKKFLDQDFSGAALAEFRREVRIMRRLRHPNVVVFRGAVTRPPNLSIVTEFLPRGSLYRILHRSQYQIDEKRRIKMALDVAKGMNCLHSSMPTIVHRDLKSPNLLVDKNWNVKVCDFGLSRLKHNTFLSSKSTAGTPEWMAPEVLRNEPSNEKCDVYSFGVILWELATMRLPWSGMNPMQVVGAVGFQNRRLEIPKEVHPLVARFIWECWQMDSNLRPSFAQLSVALSSLQHLVIHPQPDHQNSLPQEIFVNSTP